MKTVCPLPLCYLSDKLTYCDDFRVVGGNGVTSTIVENVEAFASSFGSLILNGYSRPEPFLVS
jgi:hypothetical protein